VRAEASHGIAPAGMAGLFVPADLFLGKVLLPGRASFA